jgi:tetratricopeptide (TPR) repeat protein
MIPSAEQFEEISKAREGSLTATPLSVLLCALALHERSLVLEVHKGPLVKKLVMEYGVPVDCRSNLVHETLGRFIASTGKLSEEQGDALWRESASLGVPLGEHLIAKGLVSAQELYRILQANLAKKLLDLFSWHEGEFRVSFDVPKVDSPLKVKVPQLIVTGISKFARKEEAEAAVGRLIGQRLGIHPDPPFPVEDLRFTDSQKKLMESLQKGKRVDELAMESGVALEEISRFLYAMALLGIVVPATQIPAAPKPEAPRSPAPAPVPLAPAAPIPPASQPAPPGRDPEAIERLKNEVMQAFLVHRRRDPFDLLGLPETATLPQIREAHLAHSKKYAPWLFEEKDLETVRDRARDLFFAGAEAYARLADYDMRTDLLSKRRAAREEATKKSADAFAIKTDLLDPVLQFKKGMQLKVAQDFQGARRHFEFSADCDPQNGAYRAEAAHCLYLYAPLSVKQALRELDEALRADPRCGLAAYYAGEILRASGDRPLAESWFRRAAQLMPKDPRPVNALKAMNLLRR